ncbi:hypothetical protein GF362_03025 [Candidatus Dojkabacteria bacterium]|nr:hypothetical protein [Candidatus Dojkabacteria bacterium]
MNKLKKYKKIINKIIILLLILPLCTFLALQFLNHLYWIDIATSFLPEITIIYILYIFVFVLIYFWKFKIKIIKLLLILNLLIFLTFPFKIIQFYLPFHNNNENLNQKNVTKILSINLWWENKNYNDVKNFLTNQDADILILIEFTDIQYERLKDYLDLNYPYSNINNYLDGGAFAGNIIFSKHKILTSEENIINGYYSGFSDILVNINNKNFKLYLIHTTAPINKDYFHKRNEQLKIIANEIRNEETENIIIMGDFNLSPWSYYYQKFCKEIGVQFNNISRISGFGYTWNHREKEYLRTHIDHFFVSKNIETSNFEIMDFPGSDHRALIAEIVI